MTNTINVNILCGKCLSFELIIDVVFTILLITFELLFFAGHLNSYLVWQKQYVMKCDLNVILNKCKHILLSRHVRFRYPDDVKGFLVFIQSGVMCNRKRVFTWNLWRREEFPSLPERLSSRYVLIFQGGKWLTVTVFHDPVTAVCVHSCVGWSSRWWRPLLLQHWYGHCFYGGMLCFTFPTWTH